MGELAYRVQHEEVVAALAALGDSRLGEAIRKDRKSELQYLGVRFPALRARVKEGFSFTSGPGEDVLTVWDDLWRHSPWGDVLFAALEYYVPVVCKLGKPDKGKLSAGKVDKSKLGQGKLDAGDLWLAMRGWIGRVDNWCHCDQLSRVYSHLLEHDSENDLGHDQEHGSEHGQGAVYEQIEEWNRSEGIWERRTSLVSLVHYSGKNSVFLPPDRVLPLVENCADDHRHYIQTAVGWVLREMSTVYPDEVRGFLDAHGQRMTGAARKRATERLAND